MARFNFLRFAALVATGLVLSEAGASAVPLQSLARKQASSAIPFDGQYINPPTDTSLQWWYSQMYALPEVPGSTPQNLQVTWYNGQIFSFAPSGFENYVLVNGQYPNGTVFNFQLNATSFDVQTSGEQVIGSWYNADGGVLSRFETAGDFSTFTGSFNHTDLSGSFTIRSTGQLQHHFGCAANDSPFLSEALAGQPQQLQLSAAEDVLYNHLSWPATIPQGTADVRLSVHGAPFAMSADGYHDANSAPVPLDHFIASWNLVIAPSVGPYSLTAASARAPGSALPLETGFLANGADVLMRQCGVNGTRTADTTSFAAFGARTDPLTGLAVPQGYVVTYTLADGDVYRFTLTSNDDATNPDTLPYFRWNGRAVGGKVGGEQYEGNALFELLDPSFAPPLSFNNPSA